MQFPVMIPVGPYSLHPHAVFDALAYFVGYRVYATQRKRSSDAIASETRYALIAGAALGGALGAKILHWFYNPALTLAHINDVGFLLNGKTIVGGLLGGLIGVEITKKLVHETRSTGDLYVLPLCVGIALGRVGCFLTGLDDLTYGAATQLPWGVNFGDGIARHPAQLYEIVVLIGIAIWSMIHTPLRKGDNFRGFMVLYLAYRFLIDPIKPEMRVLLGMSSIQIACLCGLLYYLKDIARIFFGARGQEAQHG